MVSDPNIQKPDMLIADKMCIIMLYAVFGVGGPKFMGSLSDALLMLNAPSAYVLGCWLRGPRQCVCCHGPLSQLQAVGEGGGEAGCSRQKHCTDC